MSPPPTNIDGTDITGATIDGQDVEEITVDGQTVFSAGPALPDSTIARYDFSSQAGTSLVTDSVGSNDLNGSYSGPTADINGVQAGSFIKSNQDELNNSSLSASQPFEVILAMRFPSLGEREYVFDGQADFSTQFQKRPSDEFQMFAGSDISGSSLDTANHIIGLQFDSTNSVVRLDGTDVLSGDVSNNSLSGLTLGARGNGSAYGEFVVGDLIFFNTKLSSNERSQVETLLSNKFGIAI